MRRYAALAALAASASAYHVSITNYCPSTVYIWSCGDTLGEMQTLEPGADAWTEDFYTKASGGGPSIYAANNAERSGGHAQLEYMYDGNVVWFDLSLIDGDPFNGSPVTLGSDLASVPYEACEPVKCSGVGPCVDAYLSDKQLLGTHDCPPSNLKMTLCGEGSGSSDQGSDEGSSDDDSSDEQPAVSSGDDSSAPASPVVNSPAPQVTTPPAADQAVDPNVHVAHVVTTVVKVVKVAGQPAVPAVPAAQDDAPSAVYVGADNKLHGKRDHLHQHQRVHGKHARRHAHQS